MRFTIDTKIGEMIDAVPNYRDIFKKHYEGREVPERVYKLLRRFTLRTTSKHAKWTQEQIDAFLKDMNDAAEQATKK